MRTQAVIRGLIVLAAGVLAGSAAAADGSGAGSERNGTVECNLFHGMKKGRCTSVAAGVGCASAEYEEIADRVSQGNG